MHIDKGEAFADPSHANYFKALLRVVKSDKCLRLLFRRPGFNRAFLYDVTAAYWCTKNKEKAAIL